MNIHINICLTISSCKHVLVLVLVLMCVPVGANAGTYALLHESMSLHLYLYVSISIYINKGIACSRCIYRQLVTMLEWYLCPITCVYVSTYVSLHVYLGYMSTKALHALDVYIGNGITCISTYVPLPMRCVCICVVCPVYVCYCMCQSRCILTRTLHDLDV